MAEKIITIDDISLIDLLGVENSNLRLVANAFPKTKIVSRGNEIKLIGSGPELVQISEILDSLVTHFGKHKSISTEKLKSIINREPSPKVEDLGDDVILFGDKGLIIKPKTDNQKLLVSTHLKNDLVFAVGPAGTGKTYISVALAVKALKNKEVKKIVITRPAVEAGESLGFLPGDLKEKVDPYLRPIYDALDDMIAPDKLKYYYENRIIEIAPLAFMRGRTLHNAFILLDEAQNTTPMQMKMFLTRMGPASKAIITGDKSQIDLPKNLKSGLIDSLTLLKGIKGISFVELDGSDVVRHRLVRDILEAYEKSEQ